MLERLSTGGIRGKVALLALVCAVLPSVLISIVAFSSARAQLETAAESELSRIVESELAGLQSVIESASRDLGIWSSLHTMQNVLLDDEDGTISQELQRLRSHYPRFGALIVVNSAGRIVASSDGSLIGRDLAGQKVATAALNGTSTQTDVDYEPLIDAPAITLGFPIRADYEDTTIIGALIGVVAWQNVRAELSQVRIWGAAQDNNHRLVLHSPSGKLVFGGADSGDHATAGTDASDHARIERSIIGSSAFLTGTAESSSGWIMHAMIAEDVAFAGVTALGAQITLLSSLIILAAMLIGAYASGRSIVAPIAAVTKAMSRIARGETDIDVDSSGRRDEIGQMLSAISTFRNKLLSDNLLLQQSQESLREQNVRFDSALTHMSQGLSMFDAQGMLTVCNPQFGQLYRLPGELTRPGTSLRQMISHLVAHNVFAASDADRYVQAVLSNARQGLAWDQLFQMGTGTEILISHQPMPGGGWVATHADVTERRRAEAQIFHMARHDALTGLPNRVVFRGEIEQALSASSNAQVAVLCLDLDRFKNINDTLGHPVGDLLLKQVAIRLKAAAGERSVAARLGGDEFALIHFEGSQPEGAITLARTVIASLAEPYTIDGHQLDIGASIGISVAPGDGTDADILLKNADLALYRAKADGGNAFRLFEPEMDARMQARRILEIDLRAALQRQEFRLAYQPLVNIESDEITGFEALVRWHHPVKGIISPADFIPLAEETGLIVPLGEWILRQACQDAARWPSNIRIAINLSPVQFRSHGLLQAVFSSLAASRLSPTRLDLEITETVLLKDSQATLATLHQLKDLGVRISMDDFGTGYSSLSYLQKFPFSKIKIDQSFIQSLGAGDESLAIIRAVTGMSRSLGMITTAEGVETVEQLQTLRSEGCTEVQGYLISRPQSFEEATALLEKRTAVSRLAS
jgi:diguanylate cyclase (GGDEF)-like protein